MPVIHMIMRRWRSAVLNEAGMIRMSSLGMPSGPGDLLFRKDLRTHWKVCGRVTYGRRVVLSVRLRLALVERWNGSSLAKGYASSVLRVGSTPHSVLKCFSVRFVISRGSLWDNFVSGL